MKKFRLMTSASDIIRFLRRLGVLVDDGIAFFAISSSNSLQKSLAIQKNLLLYFR